MIVISDPGNSSISSFFVFSLPKAGSTLLNAAMLDICGETGISYFAPTVELFKLGHSAVRAKFDVETLYRPRGYCFSGFREFPYFLSGRKLAGRKAVLLVRDPRDILTSLYFSTAISHAAPGGDGAGREEFLKQRKEALETSIDDFIRARLLSVESLLDRYVQNLRNMDLRIYRYEDVIYRKLVWLRDIVDFLGIDISATALDQISVRHDLQPAEERPDQHVRQVRPGDHRRKLRPDSIEFLNANLSHRWRLLDYPFERAHDEICLPGNLLRDMPDPCEGKSVAVRIVDAERVAQVKSAMLPRSPTCTIDPNRGAEFVGLWLEDQDGNRRSDVPAGDRFTIAYILHVQEAVGELSLGVRIADAMKNGVASTSMRMMQLPLPTWPPGTLVEARWEMEAPARPGEYLFSCGCALANEPGVFAARHLDGYVGRVRG